MLANMWALSNLCQLGKIWNMFHFRPFFSFFPIFATKTKCETIRFDLVIQFQVDETYFSLYPFSQGMHAFTQIGRNPLYLFSFNIISIRKLTSFFSWVKIAKGKTGGSSEQTKPFAVSFCAGWKYLAIGHCRFTTSFRLCRFEDRKDQMYLSGMFCEKVRQSLYK